MYIVQPYKVGSATGKSLAIIVPAELVKEYKIGIFQYWLYVLTIEEKR